MSAHVEIPRPYESAPGRFTVELHFAAASKRRAVQHHTVAWHLAQVHEVVASTPYKVNRRWSVYEEQWGNGERNGWLDERRLRVDGAPRALARYLAALDRVLEAVESLATRAARVFGSWARSVAAEAHLEYEDASTMRTRHREFRVDALRSLAGLVGAPVSTTVARDDSRPLWEQPAAVSGEVWAQVGGVDLVEAADEAVEAHLARMLPVEAVEPAQEELFALEEVTVRPQPAAAVGGRASGVPKVPFTARVTPLVAVGAEARRGDRRRYDTAA
ncbi:hypothetical protein [Streptomyces sp. NPDC001635]